MKQYGGEALVVKLTAEDQAALDALGNDEEFAAAVNEEEEVVDDDDVEVERKTRPDNRKGLGYKALLPSGFRPSTSSVMTM